MADFAYLFHVASILFYLFVILKFELQMMQQNSYRNQRYFRWLKSDWMSPRRISDVFLLVGVLILGGYSISLYIVSGILIGKSISLLRKKYKKKLVFTQRAIRLYCTAILIVLVAGFLAQIFRNSLVNPISVGLLLAILSFAVLMLANILNVPVEKSINRWYYNDARRILNDCPNLIIIGITGSYGKTSTKHYLHRILSEKYNVLMTPGSFNTTLGVIRTIREYLKPYHQVFIVEMGAKQPGDIKEICDLVHPRIGIITAVGEQHLESFKSIENVQKTKFELIDSLPANGLAVLNNDFEYVANRPVEPAKQTFRYSAEKTDTDYYITDTNYTPTATRFKIMDKSGKALDFSTHLAGSYNLSNLLSAYIVAKHLELDDNSIGYAMGQIEQVEHRLNIKRTPAGITIIDDAFNSNPHGAKMALEVIRQFTSGKRIVVTPGMIELGSKQHEYNYRFGIQMADSCDYAVVVGQYNREAIVQGLRNRSFPEEKMYLAPTFTDAIAHLTPLMKAGDVVLYENDLPDTFK